jgi:hypothetical protein
MHMHRYIVLCVVGALYYGLCAFGLSTFDIGSLGTALVLYGFPAYFLARYSAAPTSVLVSVVTFGLGLTLLLEGIAHAYGIWYAVGVEELRLFGLIPLEIVVIGILQTLFLALLYELIFDNGEYSESPARHRFLSFVVFTVGVLGLLALHTFVLEYLFFSNSYLWIVGILLMCSLATLATLRALSFAFWDKLLLFSAVSFVPLFTSLTIAVANTHKVFAHTGEYLYSFTLFGTTVPLEELLLMLALPVFIATFYELYLDDQKIEKE